MTDLLDDLRAADPARDGGRAAPVEALRARLDHEPPVRRRSPARRGLVVLAAGSGVAAAGAAAVLVLGTGSGPVDIVARARAAVSPPGSVVHLVTETRTVTDPGGTGAAGLRPSSLAVRTEQWSTTDPLRWRRVVRAASTPHGDPRPARILPLQSSFAGGVYRTYVGRRVVATRLPRGVSTTLLGASQGLALAGFGGGEAKVDPVEALRTLLDAGVLRPAGEATVDGRRVRRLVADTGRMARAARPRDVALARGMTVLVDAATGAPVRVDREIGLVVPRRGARGVVRPAPAVIRTRFLAYERLPLNASTASLVRLQVPAGTPTVRARSLARKIPRRPTSRP